MDSVLATSAGVWAQWQVLPVPSLVLCKVLVSVFPEMWLSVHLLPSLQLHPGTVLYPAVSPALSPSTSPAAPKRRKGLSFPGVTVALPLLTASARDQEHTTQVRLPQLHCIFSSCGIEDLQTALGASRQKKCYHVISKKGFYLNGEWIFRPDYVLLTL